MNKEDRILSVIRITKEYAALEQLKSAMFLWFHEGDPVSIHTLAAAAHDCFYWLVKHENQESILRGWMSEQSKGLQAIRLFTVNYLCLILLCVTGFFLASTIFRRSFDFTPCALCLSTLKGEIIEELTPSGS